MSKQIADAMVSDVQVTQNRCGNNPSQQQQDCVEFNSKSLGDCPNESEYVSGIKDGVVADIPVVLADLSVRFFVSSRIDLPEAALEVKNIRKKLKVTQCMLIQPTDVLFIKGFVRKSIEYITRSCSDSEGVCGDIRHCTIDVPFECTTCVDFYRNPRDLHYSYKDEFSYLKRDKLPRSTFAEKDSLMSSDFSEYNQASGEWYNQLPFCELVYSDIFEFDEFINRQRPGNIELPFEEKLFTEIEEKMVIQLRLKLLQKRQVVIPRNKWHRSNLEEESEDLESKDEESKE